MTSIQSYTIDELSVGMTASLSRVIDHNAIVAFAEVSGDHNPVHLDEEFAANTMFKTRIAHGMLSASLFSTVIGMQLPGQGTIYLSQTLNFRAPVKLGDTVTVTVEITDIDVRRRRVTIACVAKVGNTVVIDGEAKVLARAAEKRT